MSRWRAMRSWGLGWNSQGPILATRPGAIVSKYPHNVENIRQKKGLDDGFSGAKAVNLPSPPIHAPGLPKT
jgi:hypothetical protein